LWIVKNLLNITYDMLFAYLLCNSIEKIVYKPKFNVNLYLFSV